jgi:hypothetical protein
MAWRHGQWEEVNGLRMMRLCGNPDDGHQGEHWPRILVLDLSAEQYDEFQEDPLQFTIEYSLYPEQPIRVMCDCAKLPMGDGIPEPDPDSRWTVIIWHGRPSGALCISGPQNSDGD